MIPVLGGFNEQLVDALPCRYDGEVVDEYQKSSADYWITEIAPVSNFSDCGPYHTIWVAVAINKEPR